jgi:hypothetical protein
MGLYTNPSFSNGYVSSSYTSVEPFKGEHFNYHELGIIAATESASNRDAFMKAIALNELASVEQYGTDQVFYESVNLGSVFDRIKAFFKKIIEKIHKIFHTFIAKLGSWFQSSKEFAKKYEKEIIKKWGLVKNDWEFKGYEFTKLLNQSGAESLKGDANNTVSGVGGGDSTVADFLSAKTGESMVAALKKLVSWDEVSGNKAADVESKSKSNGSDASEYGKSGEPTHAMSEIKRIRENMDSFKDKIRKDIVDAISGSGFSSCITAELDFSGNGGGLDAKEYTEELFKVFRNGEDSKDDLTLSKLGSATEVINQIKEFDKTKSALETAESRVVKSIDKLIDAVSKAQDELIKQKETGDNGKKNEQIIQCSSVFQSVWGFVKECQTQAFSALLQATKDRCAQAKEVCVKVIGSSKKMTEESVDYSNYSDGGNFNSFIESVKLV